MTPAQALWRLLRKTRARSNLTLRECSGLIGITAERISHLECAHGSPMTEEEVELYVLFLKLDF